MDSYLLLCKWWVDCYLLIQSRMIGVPNTSLLNKNKKEDIAVNLAVRSVPAYHGNAQESEDECS